MARFKAYITDNVTNQILEVESDGVFLSMPNEEGANVMFGTDMTGADIMDWVLSIPHSLESALKREPRVYAAYQAAKLYNFLTMDEEEED